MSTEKNEEIVKTKLSPEVQEKLNAYREDLSKSLPPEQLEIRRIQNKRFDDVSEPELFSDEQIKERIYLLRVELNKINTKIDELKVNPNDKKSEKDYAFEERQEIANKLIEGQKEKSREFFNAQIILEKEMESRSGK